MDKGSFKKFISGNTAHRFPKMVTLGVTSCLLVGMIGIDASASGDSAATVTYVTTTQSVRWSLAQLAEFANHWQPPHSVSLIEPLKLRKIKVTTPVSTNTAPVITATAAPPVTTTLAAPPVITTTAAPPVTTTTAAPPVTTTTAPPAPPTTQWPVGVVDSSEASGYAPPSATALTGYTKSHVVDFTNLSSLPSGWDAYSSPPSGDTGAQFGGSAHDVVGNGILSLNTWKDATYGGAWATGGVCDCGYAPTYGAFFVRSRVTGAGPTNVELLWPQSNNWPPEIDFNETYGSAAATSGTVHWSSNNTQYHSNININMMQWHTWGVVWTPTSIKYTVDGNVWDTVSSSSAQIPNVPMHLALQQQTWCAASPAYACPTAPESMQINWVAVYTPN